MIDPHVHLRDWDQSDKETIEHGLRVAKRAGFNRLFDMPNTSPALTSREVILDRLACGSEAVKRVKNVHYHLYAGLTADEKEIRAMVSLHNELFPLVIGLKLFAGQSTGNMGIIDESEQEKVFRVLTECQYSGVLVVHAEKEALINSKLYDPSSPSSHSLARPREAEIESVKDMIRLAESSGFLGTLHIAHISTKGAIEEVIKARERGLIRITMGATPHHALYTSEAANVRSRYLKMNPPLRGEDDRQAVFSALLDGTIDWVESDHAPHTREDKERGSSGIPGFKGMLLLLKELRSCGASEERLRGLFGERAEEIFKLEGEEIKLPSDRQIDKIANSISSEYQFDPYSL